MADKEFSTKVSKIAILNPYLLRGITESSEVEASERFILAAKNMGIQVEVFKHSDDIEDFNPDFVVPISHQEPKLTRFPTYGLLTNPLKWALSSERFLRNIFSYDGYFLVNMHVFNWLKQVCQQINKPLFCTNASFSVPKTEFQALDYKNAIAAYMGLNWDGLRHYELFQHLAEGDFVKCFGPADSWAKYPAHIYGGVVPFDGVSALKTYATHGIGLGINHPDMDNEGIPTMRTYEISAASAVAICADNNPFIKEYYKDSVLYVDKSLSTKELADVIKEKINWVRTNPKAAQEMAKAAHDIFNKHLSLEFFIGNMLDIHKQVLNNTQLDNQANFASSSVQPKITYIIPMDDNIELLDATLEDIRNQAYNNINIVLLAKNAEMFAKLNDFASHQTKILSYDNMICSQQVLEYLHEMKTEWVGIVKPGDRLFPHHCKLLLNSYNASKHDKNNECTAIVFSSSLEHSSKSELRDKIQDSYMLYLSSKSRIGNITPCGEIPLCSALLKLTPGIQMAIRTTDFNTNLRIEYSVAPAPLDIAIHNNIISCSSSVIDRNKSSILIVSNAATILNFTYNYEYTQGQLLLDERQKRKMALS